MSTEKAPYAAFTYQQMSAAHLLRELTQSRIEDSTTRLPSLTVSNLNLPAQLFV